MKKIYSSFVSVVAPALILASSTSVSVMANQAELSISDDMIDARFISQFENNFLGKLAILHADASGIDSDQLSYHFYTEDQVEQFDVHLGGKVFWLDSDGGDGYGISLGAGASIELMPKLRAGLELFYAPDVLTGDDLDNLQELDLRVGYQLLDNGSVFIGYRKLEADNGAVDFDIYDDPYIGIRFEF